MDDLFSVFSESKPAQAPKAGPSNVNGAKRNLEDVASSNASPSKKKAKRETVADDPPFDTVSEPHPIQEEGAPAPVVVADSFEQEASREVASSKGLAGQGGDDAESAGQISLSHQVCGVFSELFVFLGIFFFSSNDWEKNLLKM